MDRELQEIAQVLRDMIKLSGLSQRAIEKQLGIPNGALGRLLDGATSLQLRYLLQILRAIGMEPAEFFQIAYSTRQPSVSTPSAHEVLAELRSGPDRPGSPLAQRDSPDGRTAELLLEALAERVLVGQGEEGEGEEDDRPQRPERSAGDPDDTVESSGRIDRSGPAGGDGKHTA